MWCVDLAGAKLSGGESILNSEGGLKWLFISLNECDPAGLGPGEECKTREEREAYLKRFPGLAIPLYTNTQTFNETEFQENPI